MLDCKAEIRNALLANAELVAALGGPHVYAVHAPQTHDAYITFFELTNYDVAFADDAPYGSSLSFQIDIWSKGNPRPIATEVDRAMKALGFVRIGTADLYEDDTKQYHRALRYRALKEDLG